MLLLLPPNIEDGSDDPNLKRDVPPILEFPLDCVAVVPAGTVGNPNDPPPNLKSPCKLGTGVGTGTGLV